MTFVREVPPYCSPCPVGAEGIRDSEAADHCSVDVNRLREVSEDTLGGEIIEHDDFGPDGTETADWERKLRGESLWIAADDAAQRIEDHIATQQPSAEITALGLCAAMMRNGTCALVRDPK